MFGPDHEQIPTLYRDTQLIYKSSDFNNPNADGSVSGTPTDYYLERFSDLGWSIGLTRLSNPDGTKYRTAVIEQNFYPGCSAVRNLQLQQDASLVIDKINGVPITGSNVSSVGTVTGLTMGTEYTVDAYIGTTPVGGQVMADVHMFGSFELYDLKDYELDSTGYAIINIPDYMWSGYYYINGMGLFRYVNGYKAYGTNDVEYNTAYFMGKDKNGNIITNPAPASTTSETNKNTVDASDVGEPVEEMDEPFTYHYKVTIDNQQKNMSISVAYSEAMTYTDSDGDGEYEVVSASDGALIPGAAVPTATLTSPSGQVYSMTKLGAVMQGGIASSLADMADVSAETEAEQAANTLNATIDNPDTGTWTVDIKGMYARTFTISTAYAGSSTNMIVKNGTNASTMNVYVPENMSDAVFKMTWDELGHTGVFTVIGPEGKTVATNARDNKGVYKSPDSVLSEQYGEVDLALGSIPAGEYKIKITGESLGHVYWNYLDRNEGDNSSVMGENEYSDESSDESSAETSDDADKTEVTSNMSKDSNGLEEVKLGEHEEGDLTVEFTFDTKIVNVVFTSPSGIKKIKNSDGVKYKENGLVATYTIENAEAGEWKVQYIAGDNTKIDCEVK